MEGADVNFVFFKLWSIVETHPDCRLEQDVGEGVPLK